MAEREYKQTPDWPSIITPLTGNELAEIWQDGEQRQGPLSVLGGVPSSHAASHKFGGTDVVGTQDKAANAIPITDGDGSLDTFVSDASTTKKGKVQLAVHGESTSGKAMQSDDPCRSNSRTPTAHAASHLGGSDTLGLGTAAFEDVGMANGVCPLNASGQVDSGYLPSYVVEVANFAALPVTGESGKIYVTLDTNLTYRWSGSAYVEISKSLVLGETSSTAYRGDRGKTAYDHSQATGNPHGTAITDITTLAGKITPLSDLSRVMRINGDGVPTFPDNVAGALLFIKPDTSNTWNAWTAYQGTKTVSNGVMRITATANNNTSAYYTINPDSKICIVRIRASKPLTMFTSAKDVSNTFETIGNDTCGTASYSYCKYYKDVSIIPTTFYVGSYGMSTGDWFEIESIYIGSGLYDTPVYGKDGQTIATNYGVLPVPGFRGQALRFLEISGLVFDNPVVGLVGTLYGRIRRETLTGTTQIVCSNYSASPVTGINVIFGATNNLQLNVFSAGSILQTVVIKTGLTDLLDHTFEIIATGTTLTPVFDGVRGTTVSGVLMMGSGVFTVGRNSASGGDHFLGLVHDIGFKANVFTVEEDTRYHNGDDAVDSHQKSVTPVPHTIMTRKSDGRTEVADGTESLDAINKGQLDAARGDFLYQSYTAGSTFTAGQLGYLHTDGKVYLFDANAEASAKGALYIAVGAVTANNIGTFQRGGEFTTTGLTVGAIYYGSETAGAITTTPPTTSGAIVRKIGFAQSSTVLFFNPSNDYTTVTSISGISQTVTSFSPSVKFGGNEVGVTYVVRTGYMVTTGKQIEYHVDIQLTSKGTSTGQLSISCEAPPASVFSYASASFFASNVSYSGCLQSTLIGGTFFLSQLSEAGVKSDITNTNVSNNSIIRLHGVIVAQ